MPIFPFLSNATLSSASFCGRESNYRVHLAAAFDHDFVETAAYHADTWQPGARSREGAGAGVYLRFDSATVGVTIATIAQTALDITTDIRRAYFTLAASQRRAEIAGEIRDLSKRASDAAARQQAPENKDGLDRLAHADFIAEQSPRRPRYRDLGHDAALMRPQGDGRHRVAGCIAAVRHERTRQRVAP